MTGGKYFDRSNPRPIPRWFIIAVPAAFLIAAGVWLKRKLN
jgi:hypothetical protein